RLGNRQVIAGRFWGDGQTIGPIRLQQAIGWLNENVSKVEQDIRVAKSLGLRPAFLELLTEMRDAITGIDKSSSAADVLEALGEVVRLAGQLRTDLAA